MLEGLVAVEHCHLDEFLHFLGLNSLVFGLKFGQLLIGGVKSDLKLDVLQDGGFSLHELLQGVFFLRENVEFADGHGVDLVELGRGKQDRPRHQLIVVLGECQTLKKKLVEQSQSDEEGASAKLQVSLSTIEPLDRTSAVRTSGDGFGVGHGLGASFRKGVFAAGRDFSNVLDERVSHSLHFRIF